MRVLHSDTDTLMCMAYPVYLRCKFGKGDPVRSMLAQVLFDFKEYDAVCQVLQNRQHQPSLLGSSALIPHATLCSLR